MKDSIFNAAKIKQVSELQTAYNTEQKNIQIKSLEDKESLQKLSLNNAESTRNWIIVALFLILIIAGLFYRQANAAKKVSKLIAGKNLLLQQVVVEKEWLLEEVHHRVKNNLYTVICLLESQAMFLENDALKAMESSKNRIFAMSLIHQKLYLSADIETVDMSEYVAELVHNLEESFDVPDKIRFDVEVDLITLNISNAIPLGLIINEAITNSIKHAFPENRRGYIFISISAGAWQIKLEMSDNGIVCPMIFRKLSVKHWELS